LQIGLAQLVGIISIDPMVFSLFLLSFLFYSP